jgi:hypothetical protein
VDLTLPQQWTADADIDLLERPLGAPELTFTPYAIRSWRLRRAD